MLFAMVVAAGLATAGEIAVSGGKDLVVEHGVTDRLAANGLYGLGVEIRRDGFGGSVIYGNDGCFAVERRVWDGWRLRLSVLPQVTDGPEGRRWTPVPPVTLRANRPTNITF